MKKYTLLRTFKISTGMAQMIEAYHLNVSKIARKALMAAIMKAMKDDRKAG